MFLHNSTMGLVKITYTRNIHGGADTGLSSHFTIQLTDVQRKRENQGNYDNGSYSFVERKR